MNVTTLAWVVVAFAAGTLPSPYLVALLAGRKDVIAAMRRQESPGDAHFLVANRMSKTLGVVAIILDIAKGFIPGVLAVRARHDLGTVALVGVATVAGHSFAPFLRRAGGRGLTTAAGASLAITPWAMVGSGVIALGGTVARRGGFGTSIGFGLLPVFALAIGYPGALVLMCLGITGLIAVRRLEGLEEDARAGVRLPSAILSRLLFDLPRGKHSLDE